MDSPKETKRESEKCVPPPLAKLFCSLIFSRGFSASGVLSALIREWGAVDVVGHRLPFDFTRYYEEEMGSGLARKFVIFRDPVEQGTLPVLKLTSGRVESLFLNENGGRKVNVDPGLLLPDKLVLATSKPSAHRPYLGSGVYADLTLSYHQGSFRPHAWTYPDYADPETIWLMNALRRRFSEERRFQPPGERGGHRIGQKEDP